MSRRPRDPSMAQSVMDSGKIAIRKASPSDCAQIWPLVRDFAFSYCPEEPRFKEAFEELTGRSDTLVLVAEDHATTIVGYLLASYHGTFFANGPVAWVEEIMVAASARGQGVGRDLMAAAETWAKDIPTAYIALASRRAGAFYAKVDYEESATYFRKTFVPPRA